jgi:ribosomal protein S18 acetylase RimI-like enzyme
MIRYQETLANIEPVQLAGFFAGWSNPPSVQRHHEILANASHVALAIDEENDHVVGFIYAISDGILAAYIPLLEVLPDYHGRGIGTELLRRMLEQLREFYMVDLTCDLGQQTFYTRMGMRPANGAMLRNFDHQSGRDG